MPQERVKNTAITSVGFDYQTLHGVNLLCEWLAAPDRYQRIMFECTDEAPQSLDDIVAERVDGCFDYWQVKYTPNPTDNLFTWEWLLEVSGKTARARSNLRKWFDALKKIDEKKLGTVQLVTNKIPDREIELSLAGGNHFDLSKAPVDVQRRVVSVLGSRESADWLFSLLKVVHSDKGYLNLNNAVINALQRFTDRDGVDRLINRARRWTFFDQEPPPDGWITLEVVRSIISPHRPRPIPEDFTIPEGYEVPDEIFHSDFMAEIESGTQQTIVLTGPPGRGKSTYLSFLCETLETHEIPFIRHHYFLSPTDRTDDRISQYIVQESLLGQIARFHAKSGANTAENADFFGALVTCSDHYKTMNKPFVVVIDGLDHVWREYAADKRPLDELFKQLIPIPDNLVLVVGTQPVADTQLPDRLLTHAPRVNWKLLPTMSEISLMRYLQAQIANGRLFMRHDGHAEEELAESAHLMHQITGGHPLHVIYATGHLVNSGEGLSRWSIEHIPGDLSKDVRTYYDSLWLKLSYAQKDILILLAEFRFYWPAISFSSPILLPGNNDQTNLREIEHLLYSTAVGLQPFHESLIVFIKASADYTDRVQTLTPRVLQWLNEESPARLKNTWLWVVQSRMGTPDNLILGLTRDWVLDRLTAGYPIDVLVDLFAEAEESAFERRRYDDAYRLRHLKTRLINGPEFQISNATRLKICSWKCADDGAVLDETFASRHQLTVVDMAGLGQSLRWKKLDQEAIECGKDALRRHRGDSRFAVDRRDSNQMDEILYLGKVFAELNTLNIDNIGPKGAFNSGDLRLTATFINGLAMRHDLARIMALRNKLIRPTRKRMAEDAAIRVAAVLNAQIHSWAEFKGFGHSTIAGCWAQLVNVPLEMLTCTPFPTNWQDFTSKEPLARMTHEWFFKTVLVKLIAEGDFSWLPAPSTQSDYFPEAVTYLDRITQYAETVAEMWTRKIPVTFHHFYAFFADLNPPGRNEANKRYPHSEFCKTLIPIALDCQMLSTALGVAASVDAASLELAAQSPWFNLHHFREAYAQNGVRLLTDEAAIFLINHGKSYLSQWDETCEYSRTLLELCEVALLHEMEEEARQLCRLCWEYVLGYGHRKDPTMLTLLDAVRCLVDDAPDFCRMVIKEIAPQIHHITDYTDGKGTRQAQGYADNLLVKLDHLSLAEKYAGHISSGDWYYADECFASYFTGDISSVVFDALARTGLPKEAIANLRKRAEAGEQRAAELLEITNSHAGATFGNFEKQDDQNKADEFSEFEGRPEEYPPDSLETLLSDMRESKTYSMYSYLPKWYDYWSVQGLESELYRVLEPLFLSEESRRDDLHYLLDQVFESCLKLYGKKRAFRYAVQAQQEMGGWSDFYESTKKSTQRLQKVAELYPERADEFISASCFSKYRLKHQPGARVIPSDKLVFFFVKLGRIKEATELVRAMVQSVLEDTRNLPLSVPSWATKSGQAQTTMAEIRFLIARITWPVPAVKWWAIQELADLLNSEFSKQTEAELYRALAASKLETEAVELLCIFWLAKQAGYEPSVTLPTYINSQSPASALILSDIVRPLFFEGRWRTPLILAPDTYKASADFEDAQGTTVPRIYKSLLESLEKPQLPSFVNQYAFEWENTANLYPEAPLQGDLGYFYGYSRDEMTGQFVPRATQRGRSAFLRTLAVAQEVCGASQRLIDDAVQVALPLDPTLAALRSDKPSWLPMWEKGLLPNELEVDGFISRSVQQLSESEPGKVPLAISLPLYISENRIIDLQVVRWVQWEEKSINAEELITRHEQKMHETGWCSANGFQKTTFVPLVLLNKLIDSETCAAPTVIEPARWRRGYLHSAFDSRSVLFPASTVKGTEVKVQPAGGELEFLIGTSRLGKWKYWNTGWNASHPRLTRAFCGTALTADTSTMSLLWDNKPVRHFYLWRRTTLSREESYANYSLQQIYGYCQQI